MANLAGGASGGASGVTSSFESRNTGESSKSAASIKEIGKELKALRDQRNSYNNSFSVCVGRLKI